MKTLVAYFSHAGMNYVSGDIVELKRGNGELLAEFAAQACADADGQPADLFRIEAADPYPTDDYRACVTRSREELADGARPALAADVDVAPYDRVVLIYPNWCGTMPMPVYTFLEAHDFAGKEIWPLCTHEGSGLSHTEKDIAGACPGATVARGLAVKGSDAPSSADAVRDWLA